MAKFIVVKDTREKRGWRFNVSEYCSGTMDKKLDTGDYSLLGYENKITIERKGSIIEFANNLMQDRFYRELDRLEKIEHPFILLEFSLRDLISYPYCDGVSYSVRKKIKISGAFLLRKVCEIQLQYKVKIIFCGDEKSSKDMALSIFKRIINGF